MSVNQVHFIKEYCCVMQPLACALDILQCEQNMYVGYLLPTLVSLEFKLKLLKPTLKYAGPLADAVLAGIAKRFSGFFDRSDLIMASITLPQFKLCWLDDSGKEQARSTVCCVVMHVPCSNSNCLTMTVGLTMGIWAY